MAEAPRELIGASLRRKEDPRLLRGEGRFVDDLPAQDALHLGVLRSPHAHARLRRVDLGAVRACQGVVAAVAGAEVHAAVGPLPSPVWKRPEAELHAALDPLVRMETHHLVAVDKARFAGQAVALVLAESRYAAEDALERAVVDYEPLPTVADVEGARQSGAPLVHEEYGDNLALRVRLRTGDVEAAFAQADHVVRRRFQMQRISGCPIETRGVLARPEAGGGLTVWAATQTPHLVRDVLARLLRLDAERIRVVAHDVGGGFGAKGGTYPEAILASWLALQHGRPVKWIEDRAEHLQSAMQSRDQVHDVELALRADGTMLGLRDRFTIDSGAYNPLGLVQPYNSAAHLVGPYRVPALDVEGSMYYTNKAPLSSYRGAGRPECVFAMDRIVDVAATELQLDPADVRRRNLITAAEMPYDVGIRYRDGEPQVYDSGDYPACLEEVLRLIKYDAVRSEQPALWARGIYRGVGVSAYVEGTGVGPWEGGAVGVDAEGQVWVYSGACSQGQGHETTFAQLCAAQLGLGLDQVTVVPGDTGGVARGKGTLASRSTVTAGMAIAEASQAIGQRLRVLAADVLEADAADLELRDGTVRVRGVPDRVVTFAALAAAAASRPAPEPIEAEDATNLHPPEHAALSLRETRYYTPPTVTYANAIQAAEVEVDVETGLVRLLEYAIVHDCGRVINPILVDGQIHGGVAQGIGNALLEELAFDAGGQLQSGSLLDYLLPTAEDVPALRLGHVESPSPRNPLGLKGLGEGGAISPPAAIANAVVDALRPLGVEVEATPLSPERILALVEAARERARAAKTTAGPG
jgi:aerobic carbon-monoxide dehydrogenase large subunit